MNTPDDLKYTKNHEWVRDNGDGTVSVGITDFAQNELGDIVFLDIQPVDSEFTADEVFGTVEAVKTVSDLYCPVSGVLEAVNEELESSPELVNTDPYGDGWIIRITCSDPGELDDLLSAEEYAAITS